MEERLAMLENARLEESIKEIQFLLRHCGLEAKRLRNLIKDSTGTIKEKRIEYCIRGQNVKFIESIQYHIGNTLAYYEDYIPC